MFVEDLIDEFNNDIPSDVLIEVEYCFRRYGVNAEIIDGHLDIDELAMFGLTEEERYYLYQDLYNLIF